MKSLSQLKINSAKMLNNEELINLKGGVDDPIKCNGVVCAGPCDGKWTCVEQQCTCNFE